MRTYDSHGAQVVCTSTKREYDEAQAEAEPIHFVQPEQSGWVGE